MRYYWIQPALQPTKRDPKRGRYIKARELKWVAWTLQTPGVHWLYADKAKADAIAARAAADLGFKMDVIERHTPADEKKWASLELGLKVRMLRGDE